MEAQLARRCHAQGEARGDLLVSSDAIHYWISIHPNLSSSSRWYSGPGRRLRHDGELSIFPGKDSRKQSEIRGGEKYRYLGWRSENPKLVYIELTACSWRKGLESTLWTGTVFVSFFNYNPMMYRHCHLKVTVIVRSSPQTWLVFSKSCRVAMVDGTLAPAHNVADFSTRLLLLPSR